MATMEVNMHNRTLLKSLREGDLIEFPRGLYSHWAVYVGNQQVIHLAGDDNDGLDAQVNFTHLTSFSGECYSKATVRVDNFLDVAGRDKAKRNNCLDGEKRPLSPQEIVQKAWSRLNDVGYNVLIKNCEHFATSCRYGEASSDQVDFWVKTAAIGATAALAGGLIAAVMTRDNKSKKQSQWR
ncbi:hypothetical protein C0Q70_18337 [Pomacea canaliculata]|uniref:LRAT domain-containing protein n=1 Tax=Pomacea canaliculata TaxID=400727 RepID=A0A2T7NMY9_POMCA|nr:HRAS-like suppressor 3 [Pomacea canaliculata]XP_025112659.1 HRAS-like suppressor 3 [Pomacea canaliculata]PVD22523.1 hypothetical protein C0Q70_18337 [Pomacea canaliculata]